MVVHHHHHHNSSSSSSTGIQVPGPQLFWKSGAKGQRGTGLGKARTKESVRSFSAACSFNYFHFDDDENALKPKHKPKIPGWASIHDWNMVNEDLWLIRSGNKCFCCSFFQFQKTAFDTLRRVLMGLWSSGGDNCVKMEGCCSGGAPGLPVMSMLSFISQASPGNSLYCCWVLKVGNRWCQVPGKSILAPVQMRHLPGKILEDCWEKLHVWMG